MRAALLRGSEHTSLGETALVAEGRVAIALSRGGSHKVYPHADPNEDAALYAEGKAGMLLAVADGHWGYEGAEAALDHLLEVHAERWTEGGSLSAAEWRELLLEALAQTNAVVRALSGGPNERSPRSTLALAVARPAERLLVVASLGDSHIFRAAPAAVRDLAARSDPPPSFLGYRDETSETLAKRALVETTSLAGTRALALVTDGLSEHGIGVEDPEAAVADALERAGREPAAARARMGARTVVETALVAHRLHGAGDNVAAAVGWLSD